MCTIPLNPDAGSPVADFMNKNVTRWILTRNLNELRLTDIASALRRVDHSALPRDEIYFKTRQGEQWINDAFHAKKKEIEAELQAVFNPWTHGSPAGRISTRVAQQLANRLGPLATVVIATQPTSSWKVRERLGTIPASRGLFLEN